MKFLLQWTEQAIEQLHRLDSLIGKRIHAKMEWYASQDDPLVFAKKLVHPQATLFRFRIGDYRIICSVKHSEVHILFVIAVKNRKEAYRL